MPHTHTHGNDKQLISQTKNDENKQTIILPAFHLQLINFRILFKFFYLFVQKCSCHESQFLFL